MPKTDSWTHPVYVEAGATQPRNYNPTARTSEDIHRAYTRAAMRQGKTIGDILTECMIARKQRELLCGK